MRRIALIACLISVLSPTLFGQAPAARLEFEVASIKPSEPLNPQQIITGSRTLGLTVTGTRVVMGYLSLADIVATAYKLKPFQVAGPDWIRQARFDITAKMPDGSTKEQMPDMLQSLLEERFHLKIHKEMREHPVYALTVNKGGIKFKEAAADAGAPKPEDAGPTVAAPGGPQIRVNTTGGQRGATISSAETGPINFSATPDGQMKLEMLKISMPMLADVLSSMVDRPVVDKTELKGEYHLVLSLTQETMMAMARAAAAQTGIDMGALGARGAGQAGQASDPSSGGIFASVQEAGLKLDSQKAPVETIIVDSADKAPTEN